MKSYILNLFSGKLNTIQYFIFGFILVFMFNALYLVLGKNSWFMFGYDSLDSNVIWNKLVVESNLIFASNDAIVNPAMGGLPRLSYPSEFSIELWLYYFFKPATAYILNIYLIVIAAYTGMFLFLNKIVKPTNTSLILLVSILYAILPFWPHAGWSVAGIPLLFYALIITNERVILSYIILVIYILYSSFVLIGLFLLALFAAYLLYFWIKEKKLPRKELFFIASILVLYLLTNYRLIQSVLFSDFVSHRSSSHMATHSINESFNFFFKLLFGEWGHNVVVKLPIIVSFLILILLGIITRFKKVIFKKEISILLLVIFSISFISAIFQNQLVVNFYTGFIPFLKQIQLQRFYWLLPPFFYILLFFIYRSIEGYRFGKFIVLFLFLGHFGMMLNYNKTLKQFVKTELLHKEAGSITFKQFYSENLYKKVDNYIGKEKSSYRVASIGLQPSAALYNGFYSVDGYFPNYPKQYKDLVFDIIEPELRKDTALFEFFENFGSVCLIPSSELICQRYKGQGYIVPTIRKMDGEFQPIMNLDLRFSILKNKLNCQYIFSALPINNSSNDALVFHKVFEDEESAFRIYLYEIKI